MVSLISKTVFRICGIFIRILILLFLSVTFKFQDANTKSFFDNNPALFISGFQDADKKRFFCLLLFKNGTGYTFTSVWKDNKSLRSRQIPDLSKFFCLFMEGSVIESRFGTCYYGSESASWSGSITLLNMIKLL